MPKPCCHFPSFKQWVEQSLALGLKPLASSLIKLWTSDGLPPPGSFDQGNTHLLGRKCQWGTEFRKKEGEKRTGLGLGFMSYSGPTRIL